MRTNHIGASHVAALAAIVVILVVGFAGYKVISTNNHKPSSELTRELSVPAKITTNADLQQTSKVLDSDDQSTALDTAELDADLNSLL